MDRGSLDQKTECFQYNCRKGRGENKETATATCTNAPIAQILNTRFCPRLSNCPSYNWEFHHLSLTHRTVYHSEESYGLPMQITPHSGVPVA